MFMETWGESAHYFLKSRDDSYILYNLSYLSINKLRRSWLCSMQSLCIAHILVLWKSFVYEINKGWEFFLYLLCALRLFICVGYLLTKKIMGTSLDE
jgi:hypothetical protein